MKKSTITITLIPDSAIQNLKKPVRISVNNQKIGVLEDNQVLALHSGDIIQFKLDRLTGSKKIRLFNDEAFSISLNKYLRFSSLILPLLFLVLTIVTIRPLSENFVSISFIFTLILLFTILLTFTLWRNQWLIIQKIE
jgi:hypothetical protein